MELVTVHISKLIEYLSCDKCPHDIKISDVYFMLINGTKILGTKYLDTIPVDIISLIIMSLDYPDIKTLMMVSKKFKTIIENNDLWRNIFKRDLGIIPQNDESLFKLYGQVYYNKSVLIAIDYENFDDIEFKFESPPIETTKHIGRNKHLKLIRPKARTSKADRKVLPKIQPRFCDSSEIYLNINRELEINFITTEEIYTRDPSSLDRMYRIVHGASAKVPENFEDFEELDDTVTEMSVDPLPHEIYNTGIISTSLMKLSPMKYIPEDAPMIEAMSESDDGNDHIIMKYVGRICFSFTSIEYKLKYIDVKNMSIHGELFPIPHIYGYTINGYLFWITNDSSKVADYKILSALNFKVDAGYVAYIIDVGEKITAMKRNVFATDMGNIFKIDNTIKRIGSFPKLKGNIRLCTSGFCAFNKLYFQSDDNQSYQMVEIFCQAVIRNFCLAGVHYSNTEQMLIVESYNKSPIITAIKFTPFNITDSMFGSIVDTETDALVYLPDGHVYEFNIHADNEKLKSHLEMIYNLKLSGNKFVRRNVINNITSTDRYFVGLQVYD